jgi:hypothetical protein
MKSTPHPLPRRTDGQLWHYTDVGCYPLIYLTADNSCLCPACANGANGSEASEDSDADKQWRLTAVDVYWEGPPMQCDHCYENIESAYGDPDGDSWQTAD